MSAERSPRPDDFDAEQWERLRNAVPDLLAACEAALNDRMYKEWPQIADLLKVPRLAANEPPRNSRP